MNLLIDIGNTRTKWVLANSDAQMNAVDVCLNHALDSSNIAQAAQGVSKILVANVAGDELKQSLLNVLGEIQAPIFFISPRKQARGLESRYENTNRLGVDRWLALIATNDMFKTNCLVVSAGTALTIDALQVKESKACFIGGTITAGLQLMQSALRKNTAQLNGQGGNVMRFPTNTEDAIYTGAINACLGAIQLQWQILYDVVKTPPKIILSGGDAALIAKFLQQDLAKHLIIVDNLVLRGMMVLERENA